MFRNSILVAVTDGSSAVSYSSIDFLESAVVRFLFTFQ
jgi:hypothetical protein